MIAMNKVEVGYVFDDFNLAVKFLKEGWFNWVIVEPSYSAFFYVVVPAGKIDYFQNSPHWQERAFPFPFQFPGYQCFSNEGITSFRGLAQDFTHIPGRVDIKIWFQGAVVKSNTFINPELSKGVNVVFLEQLDSPGVKKYYVCTRSRKLEQVLSFLGYSSAYLVGVSGMCFKAGNDSREQVLEKIERAL